jgi:hypothetical protein
MSCDSAAVQIAVIMFEGLFWNKTTRKMFGPEKEK